ncbi:hypothetical protein FACS189454_04040 [Planctomycetales bacterium]|nr:hypothetical protein FACS189454_04040 [Planctomycetales bacterium]
MIVCIVWVVLSVINIFSGITSLSFDGEPEKIFDILPFVDFGVTVWAIYFIHGKECKFMEMKRKVVQKP